MKKVKAYIIYFLSGWRQIEVFGLPKIPEGEKRVTVLVTHGDGSIVDVCQWFKYKNKIVWQQGGTSSEMMPECVDVKFWKPIKTIRIK